MKVCRKEVTSAQRLSAIRKRNVATSLHLYQSGPVQAAQQKPKATHPKRVGPFIEEDEEEAVLDNEPRNLQETEQHDMPPDDLPLVANDGDMTATDGIQPVQPLQNMPPEVNAARRPSKPSASEETKDRPASSLSRKDGQQVEPTAEDENADVKANQVRLDGEIKSLLERQHSHPGPSPVEQAVKGRWRKDKRLGRAPSYTSNSSASVSFRQQHSSVDAANSGQLTNMMEVEAPVPSQQVTYETPEAQEYRAKMSKKMGTRLMDDSMGTRVESPGLVRDVEASETAGVGGRVRGRQRTAKNPV